MLTYRDVTIGETQYRPGVAGAGPPVLLLHGFPETHACWRHVAPRLAGRHTVVACDLKGYGTSRGAPPGPRGEGYGNRDRAAELVALMTALGHDRFAVVGHDRGARVAYRMALDHPDVVTRLGVLNIVPTVEQFEAMTPDTALAYWPWFLLAQPFAERVAAAAGEDLVREALRTWPADATAIDDATAQGYVDAFSPAIAGICADYRAALHLDRAHDAEDRARGRRIGCPTYVGWGVAEDDRPDGPLPVWRRWAQDVRGGPLPGGHFVPEEAPDELLAALRPFLAQE